MDLLTTILITILIIAVFGTITLAGILRFRQLNGDIYSGTNVLRIQIGIILMLIIFNIVGVWLWWVFIQEYTSYFKPKF